MVGGPSSGEAPAPGRRGDGGSASHARADRARIASDRRRSDDRGVVKGRVASRILSPFLPPAGVCTPCRRCFLIFNPVLAVRIPF